MVALRLEQPVAFPHAGHIGQDKAAEGQAATLSCSFTPFFLLISPLLIPTGRAGQGSGLYSGLLVLFKPSMVVPGEAGTLCSSQPQHRMRCRNPLTGTLLFTQAINNSHKNPLPSLFCALPNPANGKGDGICFMGGWKPALHFSGSRNPTGTLVSFLFNSI